MLRRTRVRCCPVLGGGQRVAHVPAVDRDVVVARRGGGRCGTGAAFPVVLVGVDNAVEHDRQADPLEQTDVLTERLLHLAKHRLDVERQSVERPAVGREGEIRRPTRSATARPTTGRCGRRRRWRRRGSASRRWSPGAAPAWQAAATVPAAGLPKRDAQRRVRDRRWCDVSDDHVRRRVRIEVLGRQLTRHGPSRVSESRQYRHRWKRRPVPSDRAHGRRALLDGDRSDGRSTLPPRVSAEITHREPGRCAARRDIDLIHRNEDAAPATPLDPSSLTDRVSEKNGNNPGCCVRYRRLVAAHEDSAQGRSPRVRQGLPASISMWRSTKRHSPSIFQRRSS